MASNRPSMESRLRLLVQAVSDQIQAVYDDTPDHPGFEELNVLTGADLALELLDHGEAGLAFEHLAYMVGAVNPTLPAAVAQEMESLGKDLGLPN